MKLIYFIYFFLNFFFIIKCEDNLYEKVCNSGKINASADNCMVLSLEKKKKCCYLKKEKKCVYVETKDMKNYKDLDCFSNYIKYYYIILYILILIL